MDFTNGAHLKGWKKIKEFLTKLYEKEGNPYLSMFIYACTSDEQMPVLQKGLWQSA